MCLVHMRFVHSGLDERSCRMNQEQLAQMRNGKGFIAALDQSGGSTPKALLLYGVQESAYSNDSEMFDVIHAMRSRMV